MKVGNGPGTIKFSCSFPPLWIWKYFIWVLTYYQICYTCLAEELMYTNEFAIQIVGGSQVADQLAVQHGFVNKGQIGSLKDFYLFAHHSVHKRSLEASDKYNGLLLDHPAVVWLEQQHVRHRVKRESFVEQYPYQEYPDPLYPDQWFLHGGGHGGYDMNVLPAWADGYTGKGVVVSILDDGIQTNHPDLAQNYDKMASLDINGQDDDPMPQDDGSNKHGTRCAGEVAAVAFNDFCGIGVAYNASIGGVRLLDGSVTDATEATALSHNPNHIHIYSASWGPEDDGQKVDGPGPLAKLAFTEGIRKGRSGLGSIFVWASGNGGRNGDNCNCDGYTNSIYTLSISSATQGGTMPWYAEQCSSTLATTYSSGTAPRDKSIATVDMDNTYFLSRANNRPADPSSLCTKSHTGSSASAPIAAGICALALEANPHLSWRDMQYLVLMTSRPEPLQKEYGWVKNGVGRLVSTKFGYGLMDAAAMVKLAKHWRTVPVQRICATAPNFSERIIPSTMGAQVEVGMNTSSCQGTENAVVYLEHVQVKVTLYFKPRGNLRIVLVSPSGTPSAVLIPRPHDVQEGSFNDWPFMSVHFWGEKAEGLWKLIIKNAGANQSDQPGKLIHWSLIFYGTETWPVNIKEGKQTEYRSPQQHTSYSYGYSQEEEIENLSKNNICFMKQKFQMRTHEFVDCVEKCEEGYYADTKDYICHSCDKSCLSCFGPSYGNCLSCPKKLYLLKNFCAKSCPDGYYSDSRKRECLPCVAGCSSCEKSYDVCLSCKPHFFLFKHKCVPSCPPNTFLYKSTCKICHTTCASCHDGSAFDCLDCPPGTLLFNGTCISECPKGFYLYGNKHCMRCPQHCKTCRSVNVCSSCHTGISLEAGNCVLHPQQNGCDDINSENCYACSEHCALCHGPRENECFQCENEFYWSGNRCVESCPNNFYISGNECYSCPHMCQKCNANSCLFCEKNLVLYNSSCLAACPIGFYSDENHHCQACDSSCFQCKGGTSYDCTSCQGNYFLMNYTCVSTCPEGYFGHEQSLECAPCYHLCRTCTGFGQYQCTSCHKYSSFVEGVCVPCLDDEYFDETSKKCLRCHSKCGRCSGPSEFNCLSCQAPLRLDEANHSCLPCCTTTHLKHAKCCMCSEELDICIISVEHPRSIDVLKSDTELYEVVIPMNHVVPIVVAICASAVVLFVILFGVLQAHSMGWCQFRYPGKDYVRVPNHLAVRFDSEMETVSLTQDDPDEEEDIYEKA